MRKIPSESHQSVCTGAEYTAEEREFLAAIDRYKREHRRPFPTWVEVLRVVKSLGYARPLARGHGRP